MKISVFEPGSMSGDLAESLFRFRFDVQVDELGVVDEDADLSRRTLEDALDARAYQIIAVDAGAIVGTGRVNILGDGPILGDGSEPPRLDLLHLNRLDPDYPANCAVCSRLMIQSDYRNTWTTVDIFAHYFAIMRARGCKWCVCLCRPESLNMFLRFGFEIHIENIEHPVLGERVAIKYDLYRQNLARRSIERYIEQKAKRIALHGRRAEITESSVLPAELV